MTVWSLVDYGNLFQVCWMKPTWDRFHFQVGEHAFEDLNKKKKNHGQFVYQANNKGLLLYIICSWVAEGHEFTGYPATIVK